jgi:sugar phosphate isomerase/epimerase
MKTNGLIGSLLLGLLLGSTARADAPAWVPKFYPFCVEMGVPGVKPRPLAQQAQVIRELGFDGVGNLLWLDGQLAENLRTLDEAGLQVYLLQAPGLKVTPNACTYDARLPDAIRKLTGRPVTVCVTLSGLKSGDPQGIEPAVKTLRELGDAAAQAGVRVSIYQHVNNWTDSLPFNIEVMKKTNHPQVGVNFNLCHWLKVNGDQDYRPLLRDAGAKIFCVTLCGAQVGAKTWTNGLIQSLDRGDFDNRKLLVALREIGYRGPIGLMCYGIPGDAQEHLGRSMKVWKTWQADWTKQP